MKIQFPDFNLPYNAFDISRYVINYENENKRKITNRRLQLLLYFLQGYHYMEKKEALIKQPFSAWAFGPTIDELYNQLLKFGVNNIPSFSSYWEIFEEDPNKLNIKYDCKVENDFKDINDTTKTYMNKRLEIITAYPTVELIQSSQTYKGPWQQVYQRGKKNKIHEYIMEEYFIDYVERTQKEKEMEERILKSMNVERIEW